MGNKEPTPQEMRDCISALTNELQVIVLELKRDGKIEPIRLEEADAVLASAWQLAKRFPKWEGWW